MPAQWTDWMSNPFAAIKAAADANATPQDLDKAKVALLEVMRWPEVNSQTLMDDLLQEIAGATNIVVQYETQTGRYRAAYDSGD